MLFLRATISKHADFYSHQFLMRKDHTRKQILLATQIHSIYTVPPMGHAGVLIEVIGLKAIISDQPKVN
jgi:hypothetical protein